MRSIGYPRFLPLVVVLLVLLFPSPILARTVSVGIGSGQSSFLVSSSSAILAVDAAGKRHSLGTKIELRSAGRGLATAGSRSLRLPAVLSGKAPLVFNGRKYRGLFRLVHDGASLRLINVLDVEDYLRGVLKMEANPAWPMEALKAQAIVSRTYALRAAEQNANKGGEDLGSSALSQAYRGMNAEDRRTDQAIAKTKGMVVLYGGRLAFTPFHSDSGGATAEVSSVWGGTVPYLRSVQETFTTESPYRQWEARMSRTQVEQALRKAGADVGTLHSLRVGETDPYGRVNSLVATGSRGSKAVKSHTFRMAAGSDVIRSTSFSLSAPSASRRTPAHTVPAPKPALPSAPLGSAEEILTSDTPMTPSEERQLIILTEQGVFNAEELMDMLLNPGKRKGYLLRALRQPRPAKPSQAPSPLLPDLGPSGATGDLYLFSGKGWGHGVGMSQWGAKALADSGWTCEQILRFYYPGTVLGRK